MRSEKHGTTLMTGIGAFIATVLIIQLWLLSAALEALLSGDRGVLLPAAIASAALAALNATLLARALRYDEKLGPGGE